MTSTTKPTKVSMSDVVESLTGYDELAIFKTFKVSELSELPSLSFPRAMIFIEERRTGKKDADAYEAAMLLRVRDVKERFVDDDEDDAPAPGEDPVTDAGKSQAAPAPESD